MFHTMNNLNTLSFVWKPERICLKRFDECHPHPQHLESTDVSLQQHYPIKTGDSTQVQAQTASNLLKQIKQKKKTTKKLNKNRS